MENKTCLVDTAAVTVTSKMEFVTHQKVKFNATYAAYAGVDSSNSHNLAK